MTQYTMTYVLFCFLCSTVNAVIFENSSAIAYLQTHNDTFIFLQNQLNKTSEDIVELFQTDFNIRLFVTSTNTAYIIDHHPPNFVTINQTTPSYSDSQHNYVAEASQPFELIKLHSKPKAPIKIFLDFQERTIQNTVWNNLYNQATLRFAAPPIKYIDTNKYQDLNVYVSMIWNVVAKDFEIFPNVDVTTEYVNNNDDFLKRDNITDNEYGVRVLVIETWDNLQFGFDPLVTVNAFTATDDFSKLIIFPLTSLFDPYKYLATHKIGNAISHVLGHSLGLTHKGFTNDPYSVVQDLNPPYAKWAPIMGDVFGSTNLEWAQWSNGNLNSVYNGNKVDEVAVIAPILGLEADMEPNSAAAAMSTKAWNFGLAPTSTYTISKKLDYLSKTTFDTDCFKLQLIINGTIDVLYKPEPDNNVYLQGRIYDNTSNAIVWMKTPVSNLSFGQYQMQLTSNILPPNIYCVCFWAISTIANNNKRPTDAYGSFGQYTVDINFIAADPLPELYQTVIFVVVLLPSQYDLFRQTLAQFYEIPVSRIKILSPSRRLLSTATITVQIIWYSNTEVATANTKLTTDKTTLDMLLQNKNLPVTTIFVEPSTSPVPPQSADSISPVTIAAAAVGAVAGIALLVGILIYMNTAKKKTNTMFENVQLLPPTKKNSDI